jgi:hypothetical protein
MGRPVQTKALGTAIAVPEFIISQSLPLGKPSPLTKADSVVFHCDESVAVDTLFNTSKVLGL